MNCCAEHGCMAATDTGRERVPCWRQSKKRMTVLSITDAISFLTDTAMAVRLAGIKHMRARVQSPRVRVTAVGSVCLLSSGSVPPPPQGSSLTGTLVLEELYRTPAGKGTPGLTGSGVRRACGSGAANAGTRLTRLPQLVSREDANQDFCVVSKLLKVRVEVGVREALYPNPHSAST